MKFYFVRHGQTEANVQRILAGSGMNHPLTPTGHEQARSLATKLNSVLQEAPVKIVSSHMLRARQTVEYLEKALDLTSTIEEDWREWHLGEWEGQSYEQFSHLLLGEGEPNEGETRREFYSRVKRAWEKTHLAEAPYLVVSHGGVWLALQDLLELPRFRIENCQLVQVEHVGGLWQARVLET
ncbi:MAG: histidine phosphatase family protein [Bdellovibrionales bacterium]